MSLIYYKSLGDGNTQNRTIETEELTPGMRDEILKKAFSEEQLFGDDEKNMIGFYYFFRNNI